MTAWNPNSPLVIGPEFFGAASSSIAPTLGTVATQRFRSNSAETIDAIQFYRSGNCVAGDYLVEIVEAGDELPDGADFNIQTFVPTADGTVTGTALGSPGDDAINRFEYVDDGDTADFDNYLYLAPSSAIDFVFDTTAFAPGGRIVSVGVLATNQAGYEGYGNAAWLTGVSIVVDGALMPIPIGGVNAYGQMYKTVPTNNLLGTEGQAWFDWGEINPVTNFPWTTDDIADFTTAYHSLRFSSSQTPVYLANILLVVVVENVERRVAVGVIGEQPDPEPLWKGAGLWLPATGAVIGGTRWAKADATDYTVMVRQSDRGDLTDAVPPVVQLGTVRAAIGTTTPEDLTGPSSLSSTSYDTSGGLSPSVSKVATFPNVEVVADPPTLLAFVLETAASATSADGQPYGTFGWDLVNGTFEQEIRTTVTSTYLAARLIVGTLFQDLNGRYGPPDADLVIEVKRRSDNVVMGTCRVAADPDQHAFAHLESQTPTVITAPADTPFVLTAGVQYYLSFASAAAPAVWQVGMLQVNADGGGVLYQEATYSGGTDEADPISGVAATARTDTPADVVAVLDLDIPEPANFDALAGSDAITAPPSCSATGISYVGLSWEPTALGVDFGYYQIQRLTPDGVTWEDIANITDETVESFGDYEARLGVQECYRIRAVTRLGGGSEWSATECATAAVDGCGYTFTTNEAPEMSVAYGDVYDRVAEREYAFPEADEVQLRRMFGRDYQVAFHPLARRGVAFSRLLLLGALTAPAAGVGPPAADALRDLAWAALSYVCIRDSDGNRWFGSINIPSLSVRQPSQLHRAQLDFIETTSTPSTPDALAT